MAYCNKGKVCISLKRVSQQKSKVNVTPTENFDFAAALESVYPLLEMVFGYLDYADLQSASSVKPSWKLSADRVLERRSQVSWVTVFRKKGQSYLHTSTNFPYTNIQVGIVLFNYRSISLSDQFCCHESVTQKKMKFADFLSDQVIPGGAEYCVIGCPGVFSMLSQTVTNNSSVSLFDSCFIPNIPNVRISLFYSNPACEQDLIRPNERLKCLLVFCKNDVEHDIQKIFERLLPEHDFQNVAIGGGIIRRTVLFPHDAENHRYHKLHNLCISFMENTECESTFDTASIVITGNNLNSEIFEGRLTKFRSRIAIRQQSMAFRICCSAKSKKNYEPKVFNKVFPNTPLLGLEAEGEIGWDCFNVGDDSDEFECRPKRPRDGYPTLQHQWSTVIVFITWGALVN